MLPKGAWENDLSKTLPKRDWDKLRNYCYKKANGKCQICGYETNDLDAHEIWEFNIDKKTQTLKDIIGICSKCHGVIHFKNSVRLGYESEAKAHFMRVNNASELDFASHLAQSIEEYTNRNMVLRWEIVAELSKFGGEDIDIKQRYLPIIINPYEGINIFTLRESQINDYFYVSKQTNIVGPPRVLAVEVDNYQGKITVDAIWIKRIEWYLDDKKIKTNFNTAGRMKTNFSVKELFGKTLYFKLVNENGIIISKDFELRKPK